MYACNIESAYPVDSSFFSSNLFGRQSRAVYRTHIRWGRKRKMRGRLLVLGPSQIIQRHVRRNCKIFRENEGVKLSGRQG